MPHHALYSPPPPAAPDVLGERDAPLLDFAPPPRYDRPVGALNTVQLSPVTNAMLGNDQEMQSGADELSGVHGSSISGGDYSREQGVGRAPGWQWPWSHHSGAFNLASLDRWNLERADQALANPHSGINTEVGVPEPPYSPIAAMDQLTNFYENDPDQWAYLSPGPTTIAAHGSVPFSEQAVVL